MKSSSMNASRGSKAGYVNAYPVPRPTASKSSRVAEEEIIVQARPVRPQRSSAQVSISRPPSRQHHEVPDDIVPHPKEHPKRPNYDDIDDDFSLPAKDVEAPKPVKAAENAGKSYTSSSGRETPGWAKNKKLLVIAGVVLVLVIVGVVVGVTVGGKGKGGTGGGNKGGSISEQCEAESDYLYYQQSIVDANNQLADTMASQLECTSTTECSVDLGAYGDMFGNACTQEGGDLISFGFSITCPDIRVLFYDFPMCVGPSCDSDEVVSWILPQLDSIADQSFESDCEVKLDFSG